MRRLRAGTLSCLAAVFSIACGSTEPDQAGEGDDGLAVHLVRLPAVADAPVMDGRVSASCSVTLQATRSTRRSISWMDMRLIYFADPGLSQPFDTVLVSGDSLAGRWNGPLTVGEEVTSDWTFIAPRPFYLKVVIRYLSGGAQETVPDLTFPCLPAGPATAAAPTISNLVVLPGDTLDPGDLISVGYTLTAPGGSWQESIELSGGCDTLVNVAAPLETSVTRVVQIPIPDFCALGTVFSVSVRATDALQQPTAGAAAAHPIYLDRIAPTITTAAPVRGEFSVGLDFTTTVTLGDNVGVRRLVYFVEPYGFRDSVNLFPGTTSIPYQLKVAAQAQWSGPVTLKVIARDSSGRTSDTLRSVADSLRIFPVVNRPVVSKAINGAIRKAIFDPRRDRIYLLHWNGPFGTPARVSVRSTTTFDEIASYPVQDDVYSMDITPSGDSLLVVSGTDASLGVIDLTASAPVNAVIPIDFPDLIRGFLWSIVAGADGKAYIQSFCIAEINLPNLSLRRMPFGAGDFGRSGDGRIISVRTYSSPGNVAVVGLFQSGDTTLLANTFPPFTGYFPISFSGDGSRISLGLRIYNANLGLEQVLFAAGSSLPKEDMQLTPDGSTLVYLDQNQGGLLRKSLATGWVIDRTPVWGRPGGNLRIALSPDGRKAAVFDNGTTFIDFVDLP